MKLSLPENVAESKVVALKDCTYLFVRSERDGWSCHSLQTGKSYALLEGNGLEGHSTSDICFLMESDENGYSRLVNYTFGATSEDVFDYVAHDVHDYETGEREPLQKNSLNDF